MSPTEMVYKNILENMSDGVMTIGLDGRIMTFNSAAEKILNLKREDALNRSFGEVFLMREGNDDFNQMILNAVYESEKIHNAVVSYNTGEKILTLVVTASFLQSYEVGERKNVAVIVVFNDITEVERLRIAEVQLTEELRGKHKELQNAYLELEDTNKNLHTALKKVQVVRIFATVFVILFFLSLGFFVWKRASSPLQWLAREIPTAGRDVAMVKSFVVTPGPVSNSIALKGTLKPIKIVNITSPFNGTVKEKFFEYGQTVRKGDLLLRMDTSETELKLREAKIVYIKADDRLKELTDWESGDEVSKAKRSVTKAKLSLDIQKKILEETEALFKKGIVPATEYENAKQQFTSTKMDYESAELELKSTIAKGQGDNLNIANFELENARQKLKELEMQLKQSDIYAPVSGTIILTELADKEKKGKAIEKGASFSQGEILLSIGDAEGLSVTTNVDEIEVTRIKKGQEVRVTGDAFPEILKGKVFHISSQAGKGEGERKTPSFELSVAIDKLSPEQREKIRLGMSANMEILIYNNPNALLVPIHAVKIEGKDRYVMVTDKSTKELKKVKVETGVTTLDSVEITKGLSSGDGIALY
ncbi:MAG: HlyD family efflux transporter periplasmic adaptor subunit [Deltaproteobacteria bacterium]|nr:HlyD family efflux transporter periplasmic adaptor subunit [Deltaproteobacteria bacterium]